MSVEAAEMRSGRVLIVDDEAIALKNLQHVLEREGYVVQTAHGGAAALALLEREAMDVVLTDVRMEGIDGMEVLRRTRERHPDTEVILITGYATLDAAVDAMRKGAFYYVAKPFRLEDVRQVVREAVEKVHLKRENRELRARVADLQHLGSIITRDSAMQRLLETARQVAAADCNVLITGESGTGKELFARYVHAHSPRAENRFLAINCGAFPEELLANELFGHERGAFTGATTDKAGLIEAADGGTLFLDEVTEMAPSMQVKLLRAIQEGEIYRLGSTQPLRVNVRFVAASNRDLQEAVREGVFRQDLFFRLNVVGLHILPLARRKDDIPLLSQYFLQKYAESMRRPVTEIAPEVMERLAAYDFPGNVRELENIIARGVALARGSRIELAHLPEDLRQSAVHTFRSDDGSIPSLADQEEAYLRWVLKEADGNKSRAARMLGIDRVSLWRKLKKYDLG